MEEVTLEFFNAILAAVTFVDRIVPVTVYNRFMLDIQHGSTLPGLRSEPQTCDRHPLLKGKLKELV